MNIKLSFASVSETPADLLVVVLDAERTLHVADDAAVSAHLQRAAQGFRDKTQKREYFATLPEGASARALVAYWSPSLKSWNLWENVKTFTARALRLARDTNLPRVALLLNAATRRRSWARRSRAPCSARTPSTATGRRRTSSCRRTRRSRSSRTRTTRRTRRHARAATRGSRRT
jgi:hypothetical protein